MNSLKKYIRLSAIVAFFIVAMTSCREDNIFNTEPSADGIEGGITFRCSDMLETFVGEHNPAGTRAAASKNPEEKAINTLHVFFFDYEDGHLLETEEYDNFNSYQKVSNTSFIKIPTGEGVSSTFKKNFERVHIVAIANIDATDDAADYSDDANKFHTVYSTDGKIQKAGRDEGGQPYPIQNYSDLKKWVYYPRIRMNEDGSGDISSLPAGGMPMIGELGNKDREEEPVNLSKKPAQTPIVNMTALMAKVNVSVKLDPDQYTDDYPLLKITGYGVRNMPIAVPFEQPDGKTRDGSKPTKPEGSSDDLRHADYFAKYNVTDVPMFHKGDNTSGSSHFICPDEAHEFLTAANVMINKDSEAVTFSYYTFENINLPDYNAKRANGDDAFDTNLNPVYPDKVKEEDKQRWKSTFAYSDRASALILKGDYTNHQGMTYKAQFTVYMGRTVGEDHPDPNIDFMVKRNHQYDNNITIHGLDYIRNSDDEVYNFDGRVNVVDDNPLYLAIVNERKVDAHATALPMDVWFMLREDGKGNVDEEADWTSEVTFTIRGASNDEKEPWIRMEKVTRSEMETGRELKENGPLVPFAFGTGARDYFTTDLVTKTLLNNGKSIYKGIEREHGWEIKVDADKDGSRSRIYFYIDENVPKSNDDANYSDRTATIDIRYIRKDAQGNVVDDRKRTLEIEQRALLKVDGIWKGNGNETEDFNKNNHVTWMEYYEEYLDHSDPLDQHDSPGELYSGLPWGLYNFSVYYQRGDNGFKNPEKPSTKLHADYYWKVYYKSGAWSMMNWLFDQDVAPLGTVSLFNTKEPPSAFHYCLGKNKRDENGNAVRANNKGWYMPGIRELERGLVLYYNDFPDFRGNFYWSSSAADEGGSWDPKNGNYARATRVNVSGNTYTYENSTISRDNGYIQRNKSLRIRAFYRVD